MIDESIPNTTQTNNVFIKNHMLGRTVAERQIKDHRDDTSRIKPIEIISKTSSHGD